MAQSFSPRLTPLALAAVMGGAMIDVVSLGQVGGGAVWAQNQRQQGAIQLSLRRQPKALDVVLEGVGTKPELQQRLNDGVWEGRLLTEGEPGLLRGPQTLSLPELGIQAVSLTGAGNTYRVSVRPSPGQSLKDPVVSADGRNLILTFEGLGTPQLQTARLDLNTPGRVPQPRYAPPLRPRAVAPPLGDMAVGTMVLTNPNFVNVSGPPVTLTLNNAPAKDALMSLARLGGYGFVYLGHGADQGEEGDAQPRLVSLAFQQESFSKAFNSVLLAAGLKGRVDGKSLLVGQSLARSGFSPTVSKVYRLNQASSEDASQYLASLGARVCVPILETNTASRSSSVGTAAAAESSTSSSTSEEVKINCFGSGEENEDGSTVAEGPLTGLDGAIDKRLSTVTLVGDARLISVAESYLKNMDLRKRQVAVKVQILNIDLLNDKSIDTSFSAKIGNTFLVSESGKAFMNFGNQKPGNSAGSGVLGADTEYTRPGVYSAGEPGFAAQDVVPPFVTRLDATREFLVRDDAGNVVGVEYPDLLDADPSSPTFGQPIYAPDTNPNAASQLVPRLDKNGQPIYVPANNPREYAQQDDSFLAYVEAVIDSSSAKALATPTLLVQEGEEAQVKTGTSVITGVTSTETANGSTQFENTRENAGLTLDVQVQKIDDNGFVTLNVNPSVSIPQPAGTQQGVPIFNITGRSLSSGRIRLRDRQTLVLTGVIQDNDREVVRKWPILGDMPFIGQLFRSTDSQREKQELVVLVTPSIIDDNQGGAYGYGYRPSTREARQLLGPR